MYPESSEVGQGCDPIGYLWRHPVAMDLPVPQGVAHKARPLFN